MGEKESTGRIDPSEMEAGESGLASLDSAQMLGLRKLGLTPISIILNGEGFTIAVPDPKVPNSKHFLIPGSEYKTLQEHKDEIAGTAKALKDSLIGVGEQAIAEQLTLSLLPKDAMLDLNNAYKRRYKAPLFGRDSGYCGVRTSTVDELHSDSSFVAWGSEAGVYTDSVKDNERNPLIKAPYVVVAKK